VGDRRCRIGRNEGLEEVRSGVGAAVKNVSGSTDSTAAIFAIVRNVRFCLPDSSR
jgi:hypothetical protein